MEWYHKGVTDQSLEEAKKNMSRGKRGAFRFSLGAGETKRIILLDDEPFCINEHHLKLEGKWGNLFTCRKDLDPRNEKACPLCLSGNQATYKGFITCLDATGYKNENGDLIKYSRALIAMTLKTLELFKIKKARNTSLVGAVIDVTRSSDSDPRAGNDWEVLKIIDPFNDEKLFFTSKVNGGKKLPPEPFDYINILEPISIDEMNCLSGSSRSSEKEQYIPPVVDDKDNSMY